MVLAELLPTGPRDLPQGYFLDCLKTDLNVPTADQAGNLWRENLPAAENVEEEALSVAAGYEQANGAALDNEELISCFGKEVVKASQPRDLLLRSQ